MPDTLKCDVLVVGSGPGGYVAAIRAGQLGLDTIIVEKDRMGGTCLIRGCIPSKALIEAAEKFEQAGVNASGTSELGIKAGKPTLDFAQTIAWKDGITDKLSDGVTGLLKHANVRSIKGWATFTNAKSCVVDTSDGPVKIKATNVILANGSTSVELPGLLFGGPVISSTEALDLTEVPKHLAVIGAGYIGMELGIAYRKLGAEVTFIEADARILPGFDKQLTAPVAKWLRDHKVTTHTKAFANSVTSKAGKNTLNYTDKDGKKASLVADKILVTVGRKPCTKGWGLENMAIDMDGPFIKIDDKCQTAMRGVYAIGDLVGEPMLAHKASAQGEMVAEILAGHKRTFNPNAVPAVCFTDPEIISVGLTPEHVKEQGLPVDEGKFRWAANGRALTTGTADGGGFVRVLSLKENGRIVGIQAVGKHISELSGEMILAIEMGARAEDLAGTIHAHPTMSEAIMEAGFAALGRPLHST
ncbi:MAG: dihydrolipoyl dehydrogenase [Acidimicrobiales bacterium]|nr:dihydrolipoyl dehydrogenase [Hyphomonadaceae bacterium]RZV41848.1 MAG: dihydrolipoyl dehydrogenase [Acidimicrobiales bacterium]